MDTLLRSSALQAHLVLALSGLTSAYIAVVRPTLSRRQGEVHVSPAATLYEAGTSPALSTPSLALCRCALAIYIFIMGAVQLSKLGLYIFKFYTIWNWWLLGIYFALASVASVVCWVRGEAARPSNARSSSSTTTSPPGTILTDQQEVSKASPGADPDRDATQQGAVGSDTAASSSPPSPQRCLPSPLHTPTPLSRACHALFLTNAATVVIVDVVCWAVLYPMLARGPQSPEVERVIKRLLLTFTSYNQHGLNAAYIFVDLLLNRHRLAFHAVGPLGLWSLCYALWAHAWHAYSGKWLYPFLDTSKPWAPLAYLGLYLVHWAAFGLVALLYGIKGALYGTSEKIGRAAAGAGAGAAAAVAGAGPAPDGKGKGKGKAD